MIFDAHCDIWTHVAKKRLEGEQNIIKNYNLDKFEKGNINGGIFVVWVDPPYDKNPKTRTKQILDKITEELKDCEDVIHIVKKSEDFDTAKKNNTPAAIRQAAAISANRLFAFFAFNSESTIPASTNK